MGQTWSRQKVAPDVMTRVELEQTCRTDRTNTTEGLDGDDNKDVGLRHTRNITHLFITLPGSGPTFKMPETMKAVGMLLSFRHPASRPGNRNIG